jgi:hypothetical protein
MDLLLGRSAPWSAASFSACSACTYGLVGQLVIATAGAVMLIWLVRRL